MRHLAQATCRDRAPSGRREVRGATNNSATAPTGRVLTRRELRGIARVAEEHDLLIFSDELYEDMIYDGEHVSIASLDMRVFERTITVFGFSKAFGIPGYRIAYLVGRGKHMRTLKERMHTMIVHADTLAQAAAKAAVIHGDAWLEALRVHLRQARDLGVRRLNQIPGVDCPVPQATPFLFPDISALQMTGEEMTRFLKEKAKVIVQNGADFGPHGEGRIRINFATSRNTLEEALDRIRAAIFKLQW